MARCASFWIAFLLLLPRVALGGLILEGDPADRATFEAMLSECEETLPSFHELMDILRRTDKDVRIRVGRGQAGIFLDVFRRTGQEVDLNDLERLPNPTRDPATGDFRFPPGVSPEAFTRCQDLAHILYERYFANFVGNRYGPAHGAATGFEERIRRDYGQTGGPINHTGQEDAMVTIYRNSRTFIERVPENGDDIGGPPEVTEVNAICLARCRVSRFAAQFGADTCDACRAQADAYCADFGSTVRDFICRRQ